MGRYLYCHVRRVVTVEIEAPRSRHESSRISSKNACILAYERDSEPPKDEGIESTTSGKRAILGTRTAPRTLQLTQLATRTKYFVHSPCNACDDAGWIKNFDSQTARMAPL